MSTPTTFAAAISLFLLGSLLIIISLGLLTVSLIISNNVLLAVSGVVLLLASYLIYRLNKL